MRWISQFYDGGRSSEIVAMTDDADGIWRVLDTVTGHESILDLRKGQVSWSPSGVLLAPVGAVILPQTGALRMRSRHGWPACIVMVLRRHCAIMWIRHRLSETGPQAGCEQLSHRLLSCMSEIGLGIPLPAS